MTDSSIHVDIFNPGHVFACLGILEAAELLCGGAEGRFDWSDEANVKFCLRAMSDENPVSIVLNFLAEAEARAVAPENWRPRTVPTEDKARGKLEDELHLQKQSKEFPSAPPDKGTGLPIQLAYSNNHVTLGHWADGSDRDSFKLYAGNRSALTIATGMIEGVKQLWKDQPNNLIQRPFDRLLPMGGSFNFDPRGGWTALDAGYSPNEQGHKVPVSPVVEILAAWGLENARPDQYETRKVRYATWGVLLPPMLARVALCAGITAVPMRRFRFDLQLSGKNKVVTFAEQEI